MKRILLMLLFPLLAFASNAQDLEVTKTITDTSDEIETATITVS